MKASHKHKKSGRVISILVYLGVFICIIFGLYVLSSKDFFSVQYVKVKAQVESAPVVKPILTLDITAYNLKLDQLAHIKPVATTTATSTASTTKKTLWPIKTVYPNAGAILPFSRIVAYYGNFYSTGMGILGQYPPAQVIPMLLSAVNSWQVADPTTPVIPAIDYIAVTAQGSPGADGKYRLRMPDSQIDQAVSMANQVNGLVFLDVQVGLSNLQTEVPLLQKYLQMPNVELAVDPEFAMHNGAKPGSVIGTLDASDINFTANYLAGLVQQYHLPPKILVVHRFTQDMVTNYKEITPLPEVQIVMDMDGWGFAAKKINTYDSFISSEPVQFTGFKLFYKNDVKGASSTLMTPSQVLKLTPSPSFIQYQ